MSGVFISHSTKNRELVERVIELLQMGTGILFVPDSCVWCGL